MTKRSRSCCAIGAGYRNGYTGCMMRALLALALVSALGCDADPEAPRADAGPVPGRQGAPAPARGDAFGAAVAGLRDALAVGVPGDDAAGYGAGAVLILAPGAAGLEATQTLRAAEPRAGAGFGAALAAAEPLLAVGAPGDQPRGDDAVGAVHVFQRGAGGWVPMAVVSPEALAPGDRFGAAVDFVDGQLVVGAPGDDRDGDGAGAVYFFDRSGDDWVAADSPLM